MKSKENKFYVYVYLDPRKPGNFQYGEFEFAYEPFYVGKGSGKRCYAHLSTYRLKEDSYKNNKIKKIISLGFYFKNGFIVKIKKDLLENESVDLEMFVIQTIGRRDLNYGPRVNLTNGGDGLSGYKRSQESIARTSASNLGRKQTEEHIRNRMLTRLGTHHSDDWNRKISQGVKILTQEQVDSICNSRIIDNLTPKEIVNKYQLSQSFIYKVLHQTYYECSDIKIHDALLKNKRKPIHQAQIDTIYERFYIEKFEIKKLAEIYGLSITTVTNIVKEKYRYRYSKHIEVT